MSPRTNPYEDQHYSRCQSDYEPKSCCYVTNSDQKCFQWAILSAHCHIFRKTLESDRVCDHCHVTKKFQGIAHNACNLNLIQKERIPVLFHNLREYDSHLIMQTIGKKLVYKYIYISQNHKSVYRSQ